MCSTIVDILVTLVWESILFCIRYSPVNKYITNLWFKKVLPFHSLSYYCTVTVFFVWLVYILIYWVEIFILKNNWADISKSSLECTEHMFRLTVNLLEVPNSCCAWLKCPSANPSYVKAAVIAIIDHILHPFPSLLYCLIELCYLKCCRALPLESC